MDSPFDRSNAADIVISALNAYMPDQIGDILSELVIWS